MLNDTPESYAVNYGFGGVVTHCGQGCVIHTRLLLPERMLDAYKEGVKRPPP